MAKAKLKGAWTIKMSVMDQKAYAKIGSLYKNNPEYAIKAYAPLIKTGACTKLTKDYFDFIKAKTTKN